VCGGGVTMRGGREVTRGRRVEDTNQIQRKGDFLCLGQIFVVQTFCFLAGEESGA
jgi:hypothetical protein